MLQTPCRVGRCRRNSCETAPFVEGLFLLQDVEAGPRQLVCQRLGRYRIICLRSLAFVEALRFGTEAKREVGRFDKGPGEVLVSVPGVAFSLLFAVADALAIDATGIGGVVADLGKAIDRPGLQQDDAG